MTQLLQVTRELRQCWKSYVASIQVLNPLLLMLYQWEMQSPPLFTLLCLIKSLQVAFMLLLYVPSVLQTPLTWMPTAG